MTQLADNISIIKINHKAKTYYKNALLLFLLREWGMLRYYICSEVRCLGVVIAQLIILCKAESYEIAESYVNEERRLMK